MSSVVPPHRDIAAALVGRAEELRLIKAFLDHASIDGRALLLSGEPGVGKSLLLDAAADIASASGSRVLRAAGAEFEADVSFSALNQLLLPVAGEFERLPVAHRDTLQVALGLRNGRPPAVEEVAAATLALLRDMSSTQPVVMIVDDVPWLDRSTALLLGPLVRRLSPSRIGFLAAARSEMESLFDRAGLPHHELLPLGDEAATELLLDRFPSLVPTVVRRVLSEARGNPLALLELSAALNEPQRAGRRALPPALPHSRRLETLFASRVKALPHRTRRLLLLAALEGSGDLGVLFAAAPGDRGPEELAPAQAARLVHVDTSAGRVAFRHPLVASSIVQGTTTRERHWAHEMLARAFDEQDDRHALHRAAATIDPDEEVAALLEQAAGRILRRGDAVGAVTALLRAADLSADPAARSRRLANAAYVGADVTGDLSRLSQLLVDARRAHPELGESLQTAVAASYLLLNGDGDVDTAHRLLVGAIETQADRYSRDDPMLVEAVHNLLEVCLYGGRPELWESFPAAISRLDLAPDSVLRLWVNTVADPVRNAAAELGRVEAAVAGLRDETDPTRIERVATATIYVDRMVEAREPLWRVVRSGREGGPITSAINALMLLCIDDFKTGRWDEGQQAADEGIELCDAHGYHLLRWPLRLSQALIAAARGNEETSRALTDEMTRWAAPRGVGGVLYYAAHARSLTALGQGDFDEAYRQAASISPPGTFVPYNGHALWAAMDLVEAAVRANRPAEAAAHVAAMREADIAALSSRLALLANGSAAMAAQGDDWSELFERALATPDADRWPFDLARVQLAYGERLRRSRAPTESRLNLTAALSTFQRLGAEPWVLRATNELRATGASRPKTTGSDGVALTPQEREIATLAAAGLTNKQIADRLLLSHRTVGAHLYRVFPKLGVRSRAALRDALASLPPPSSDGRAEN